MQIIKNNFDRNTEIENSRVVRIRCSECGSELEITKDDTHIGWLGAYFIDCPCCGREAMVDELDGIDITVSNVKFPTHFHQTSVENGAIDVSDDDIVKDIRRGISWLREHRDEWAWYSQHGSLHVAVFNFSGDEEYEVIITKDFYSACIKYEKEDYDE